jgi:hypothetical protein
MALNYQQQAMQPPPFDSSMQGAPGAPQMPASPPPLMGVQAQQPIPQPGMGGPGGAYVNPALTASVMALQGQQSQQAQIDRQRKLADSLRADSKDQMQGQQAGRVYKAAGLANLGASLADNYVAGQMGKRADTQAQGMDQQRQQAMTQYFNALTGQGAPGAGQ